VLTVATLGGLALGALSVQDAGGLVAVVDLDAVGLLKHVASVELDPIFAPIAAQCKTPCATSQTVTQGVAIFSWMGQILFIDPEHHFVTQTLRYVVVTELIKSWIEVNKI